MLSNPETSHEECPEPAVQEPGVHAEDSAKRPGTSIHNESRAQESAGSRRREGMAYDGNNSLNLYLTEIGKVKLLSPQEEIELAGRIKQGDKAARELMIKANLRLVVKIARDYEGVGLPLMDLISEGNIGLMKAVERFDPSFGAKVSTYASWWIKQAIKQALAHQSKTIRLPMHMVHKISKMRQVRRQLQEELDREPTDEELGEELGITACKVSQMRVASVRPASLDSPISEDESNTFADHVQDENAETPFEQFEAKTSMLALERLVETLSPREAGILCARFGLNGAPQQTLEEVGDQFQLTHERVRQIQNKALNKLRTSLEKLDKT